MNYVVPERWSQKFLSERWYLKKFTLYCEDGGSSLLRNIGNVTHYGKLHSEDGSSGLLRNISTCVTTRRHIRYNSLNFHHVENIKSYPQNIIFRIYTRIMFHVKYPPAIEILLMIRAGLVKCDAAYCGEHFTDLYVGVCFFRLHRVRASHCYEALFNL